MTASNTFSAERGLDELALRAGPEGLSFAGGRVMLYSHVAVEMLRRQLFHQLGDDLARAILAQAGREAGFNDAQLLLQAHSFDTTVSMLDAQYALLARSGFGRFEVLDLAVDAEAHEVYARVRCHASPEAESHRRLFGAAAQPACCHLVGYSTGWSSAVLGWPVLTIEIHCVAKGDAYCEFETLPDADFVGPEAAFWRQAFENTSGSLARQLNEKLATIEKQMATITAQAEDIDRLSTPILQVRDDILVLPVIGTVTATRVSTMSETLLAAIVRYRASGVIVDVTGVANLDGASASQLMSMVRAVRLLGSTPVVSGISPKMSQLLVADGVDFAGMATERSLQDALRLLEGRLRRSSK